MNKCLLINAHRYTKIGLFSIYLENTVLSKPRILTKILDSKLKHIFMWKNFKMVFH